tara:strand:- start:27 stop:602 length:576 start_codon:yes stop_codon:yes gene_type:complete
MPDYQKAKIYKLYSVSNEELVYYGSTIETLSSRLSGHIRSYKNRKNLSSKLVLDAEDYKMELIENYPCANKQQLIKRESEYIKNNICVNITIPCRTKKEYYEDNREKFLESAKVYRENNKEKIAECKKKHKAKNKEKISEQRKEYYENNKEKIKEKIKKKVTCECGCIIGINDLTRHKKTNKHLELIKNKI